MKTIKINIASLFWILALSLISLDSTSQDTKLSRQEKKEVRKARMAVNFHILDSLLNTKSFVLEADFLQNGYGDRLSVLPDLNFIKVNESTGIIQTGAAYGNGYNGFGGITTEGNIVKWRLFRDSKKLSYRLQFTLITNLGHFDIFMIVTSDNNAKATISSAWGDKLTWDGHLETIYNSGIFKGAETI